jgi:glycosyltransferase involved in cell wall biosynthesis
VSDRSQPGKSLGWVHDNLKHILYPRAKGLILQTEKARDIYISRSDHKNIAVIGNPVKQYFSGIFPEKREKIVLMVGRLIKTKHQDKLIEMFARVNMPGWKLIIVGYDHLKQNNLEPLKKLARDLKVEQCVVFTGKLENTEELYLKSSIFAFTSSSEGFPNVIGEAMAAGLAVISFDCVSGPSEMITDSHDGFLIPLFNYEMFQSRLAQTMSDSELRKSMGANAMESIKKFSTDKVCEAFYTFITE